MYKIYIDGHLIHNDKYENYKLSNPTLETELNNPGSLTFIINPDHPKYSSFTTGVPRFKRMKSIVTVEQDGRLIFRGRILDSAGTFYNQKQVICEGELAFLLDTTIRPYSKQASPEELLKYYIGIHNEQMAEYPEKQFVVGTVTVTDGEENDENREIRANESAVKTWDEINDKLINSLGGYLIIDTAPNGKRRINWLKDDDLLFGTQTIEYGKNLLDLNTTNSGSEITTVLIPYGAKKEGSETTTRLDITSKEDGVVAELENDRLIKKGDYIYSERGVEEYGFIQNSKSWDDITEDVDHLLKVAIEELNNTKAEVKSIEIRTVDLYKIENVDTFQLGTKVKVTSKKHNINGEVFPLTKKSVNLTNPASNTLTLTKTERTFTEKTAEASKIQNNYAEVVSRVDSAQKAIVEVEKKTESQINQSSEQILLTVGESYTLKDEHNKLIEDVNTEFQQTSEAFEMRFNEIHADIEDVANNANAHYQEQIKYIRFKDGNIILGEEGNEITLKIQNDRISFIQNGAEVAYFNNRKLYVTDGEFIQTLKLGKFAFIPRESGNLSFKKVE